MNNSEKLSRKDFLKKGMLGVFGIFTAIAALKVPVETAEAATVRDNLGSSGGAIVVSTKAPANKKCLWIDTSVSGRGVTRYWNGTKWSATASVWDE